MALVGVVDRTVAAGVAGALMVESRVVGCRGEEVAEEGEGGEGGVEGVVQRGLVRRQGREEQRHLELAKHKGGQSSGSEVDKRGGKAR